MLQVKNSHGLQLPQLHNAARIPTPSNRLNHPNPLKHPNPITPPPQPNKQLLQAIALIQSSIARNSTASLRDCSYLLKRHQLRCPCENSANCASENMNSGQLRSSLAAMEVALEQKEIVIKRLKLQMKENAVQYNEQLASLIKRKIVVDANSLNYQQILKIGRAKVEVERSTNIAGSVVLSRQGTGGQEWLEDEQDKQDKQDKQQQQHHGKISMQKGLVLLRDISQQQQLKTLKQRIKQLQHSLQSITNRLQQTQKQLMSLRQTHQIDLKQLRIIKSQLTEKDNFESYLIKQLNNRLQELEKELQDKESQPVKAEELAKLKKILILEYLEKEQMFVMTERCYLQRIERLEQQIQRGRNL